MIWEKGGKGEWSPLRQHLFDNNIRAQNGDNPWFSTKGNFKEFIDELDERMMEEIRKSKIDLKAQVDKCLTSIDDRENQFCGHEEFKECLVAINTLLEKE